MKRLGAQERMGGLGKYVGLIFTAVVLLSLVNIVLALVVLHEAAGIGGRYYLLYALAVIPLVNAVAGLSLRAFGRRRYERERALVEGINRVAAGDMEVFLNEQDGGSFESVYRNFNRMVRQLRSNRLMNENFVNDFSHELKTPIASIHGFAQVLLTEELAEADRREFLQIIADESARLADLSKNTLLLSKIDAQQFILQGEIFALDEQIKQCVIILSAQWEAKDITLSVELPEVGYWGNEELLQQVWLNLLANAVKFTPAGGRIAVRLGRREEQLVVEVSDSGPGMTDWEQRHIFDRYYQGDASRATEGHGLGLAIVKRIVALHEGRVWVRSAPGAGSTFVVALPLAGVRSGEVLPILAAETLMPPMSADAAEEVPQAKTAEAPAAAVEMTVQTEAGDAELYRECYEALGWELTWQKETAGMPRATVTLTFRRAEELLQMAERERLQAEGERLLAELARQKRRMYRQATVLVIILAAAGILAAVGAIAALRAQQRPQALLLGLAATAGIVTPYFLHQYLLEALAKRQSSKTSRLYQQLAEMQTQARAL